MKPYANRSGNSGVLAYETGSTFIRVKFAGGEVYSYSYHSAGKTRVETMKRLAASGKGLSTYISRYVKDRYESS